MILRAAEDRSETWYQRTRSFHRLRLSSYSQPIQPSVLHWNINVLAARTDSWWATSLHLHPPPLPLAQSKTGVQQQLIFQEHLFLKLFFQNGPTHQGWHAIPSDDCQWGTWPLCYLKAHTFSLLHMWDKTGWTYGLSYPVWMFCDCCCILVTLLPHKIETTTRKQVAAAGMCSLTSLPSSWGFQTARPTWGCTATTHS